MREGLWQALVEPAILHGKRLHSTRALQHLTEGFNRRVLMMNASARHIEERIETAEGKPLSHWVIPELAVHTNAFWLNLCGALDNLAWSLNYELALFPDAKEDAGKQRLAVGLFHKRFLASLRAIDATVADALLPFVPWNDDLRVMRDPGAHRIPLYPSPGYLDEREAGEVRRMNEEAARLMRSGERMAGMALIHASEKIGRYEPFIVLSHDRRLEVRNLRSELARDTAKVSAVAKLVLTRLLGADAVSPAL